MRSEGATVRSLKLAVCFRLTCATIQWRESACWICWRPVMLDPPSHEVRCVEGATNFSTRTARLLTTR
jgi:hypothetical protein